MRQIFLFSCALFLLAACGTRTNLTLPPRPAPADATATQPAAPAVDDNKASEGAAQ